MTQTEYDITEFVINNLEEIQTYINSDLSCLDCFKNDPVLFYELKLDYKTKALITYLSDYFTDIETIMLICTRDFVKIYL